MLKKEEKSGGKERERERERETVFTNFKTLYIHCFLTIQIYIQDIFNPLYLIQLI